MSVSETLQQVWARIYLADPEIKAADAARLLLDELPDLPLGAEVEEFLTERGAYQDFLKFKSGIRGKANTKLDTATVEGAVEDAAIRVWLQAPIPGAVDNDRAPSIGDCTVLMLREAISQLRVKVRTMGAQIARLERLAALLTDAIEQTGDPNLTPNAAYAQGLLAKDDLAA